jgi:hypothetical protein
MLHETIKYIARARAYGPAVLISGAVKLPMVNAGTFQL